MTELECLCCSKKMGLPSDMINVGQKFIYCPKCLGECSYVFSGGETTYFHEQRILGYEPIYDLNSSRQAYHEILEEVREEMSIEEIKALLKRVLFPEENDE